VSRVAALWVASAVTACGLGLTGCSAQPVPSRPAPSLPDGPTPSRPAGPAPTGPAATRPVPVPTPSPNDAPAVPDVQPGRRVSPAAGPVRLDVRPAPPAGPERAAYQAYLGWVGGYLAAYARPGRPDTLSRYGTPGAVGAVRNQAAALASRGWAEYGTAVLVSATVRVTGPTATVRACLDLSGLATRDTAGRLAGRDRPVRSVARLTATGAGWRVDADEKAAVPACR